MKKVIAVLFLFIVPVVAAPHIAAVVNSADSAPGIPLNSFGTVYGNGLSDAIYPATVYPFPTSLGPTTAALCRAVPLPTSLAGCQLLALTYASPTQINFIMPNATQNTPGFPSDPFQLRVTVTVGGVIDDGAQLSNNQTQGLSTGDVDGYSYNPRIFREGYDCFIDSRYQDYGKNCGLSWADPPTYSADRGAITDLTGNLITSANPAHLNQYLVAWVSGLGPHAEKNVPATAFITNIPLYGYPGSSVYQSIVPQYIGESSFPGLFQMNFQIPPSITQGYGTPDATFPAFPCGNYSWEVSLGLGIANYNGSSNLVQIPVVIKTGDVAGCK
jgi:hypothetical protein